MNDCDSLLLPGADMVPPELLQPRQGGVLVLQPGLDGGVGGEGQQLAGLLAGRQLEGEGGMEEGEGGGEGLAEGGHHGAPADLSGAGEPGGEGG